ncbi:MAG: hypothetical protein ACTSPK_00110 [Candidatus Heimdallarchaeota archaeon]
MARIGGTTLGLASQITQLNKTMKSLAASTHSLTVSANVMGIVFKAVGDILNIKSSVKGFADSVQTIKTGIKAMIGERRGEEMYLAKGAKTAKAYHSIMTKSVSDFQKIPLTKGQKAFAVLKRGFQMLGGPLGGLNFGGITDGLKNTKIGLKGFLEGIKKSPAVIKSGTKNLKARFKAFKFKKGAWQKLLGQNIGNVRMIPVPRKFQTLKQRIKGAKPVFKSGVQTAVQKVKTGAKALKGKPIVKTLMKSPFGLLKKQMGGLVNVTSKLTGIPKTKFAQMGKAFKSMGGIMKGAGLGMLTGILMQLLAAFNPLKPLISALTTIVSVWGTILGTALMPIIEKLYDVLLSPQMLDLWERLAAVIGMAFEALMPLIDIAMPFIYIILEAFMLALEAIVPLFPLIQRPLEILGGLITMLSPLLDIFLIPLIILGALLEAFAPILSILLIPMELLSGFFPVLTDAIMGFMDIVMKGVDWLIGGIKFIVNGILGGINWVIEKINLIPGVNVPTIPLLGEGGIAMSPMLAVVGDRPEAIIPLDQLGGGGGMGEITINIYGYVSDDMIVELDDKLQEYQTRKRLF